MQCFLQELKILVRHQLFYRVQGGGFEVQEQGQVEKLDAKNADLLLNIFLVELADFGPIY